DVKQPVPPSQKPTPEVTAVAVQPVQPPSFVPGAELGLPDVAPPEIQAVTPSVPMPVVSVELAQLSNGLDSLAQQLDTEKTRSVICLRSSLGMKEWLLGGCV